MDRQSIACKSHSLRHTASLLHLVRVGKVRWIANQLLASRTPFVLHLDEGSATCKSHSLRPSP